MKTRKKPVLVIDLDELKGNTKLEQKQTAISIIDRHLPVDVTLNNTAGLNRMLADEIEDHFRAEKVKFY